MPAAPRLERQIANVAVLDDPVRRALYFYVTGRGEDVSRDQAARGVRISRALAAFHLDKLTSAGLLETTYRRLRGRKGPGAGRPAKLYRRTGTEVGVSLPQREYALAAHLLADALDKGVPVRVASRAYGTAVGKRAKGESRRLLAMLREQGYEPCRAADGTIRMRNCPFDGLAREHRPLVCGMNQALLEGVIRGMGLDRSKAVLDPQPGMCCVTVRTA